MTTISNEDRATLTEMYVKYQLNLQSDWPKEFQETPEQMRNGFDFYHGNPDGQRTTNEEFFALMSEFGAAVVEEFFAA